MKTVKFGWSKNNPLPDFPDCCIACMKPTGGHLRPPLSWITLTLPYCEEHLEKARKVHRFYREYFEEDGPMIKIFQWLSWGVGIVVFMLVYSFLGEDELWVWVPAIIAGGITKLIVLWTLAGLYTVTYIHLRARMRGLTFSEVGDLSLAFGLKTEQGQQGEQLVLNFENDAYGELFEAGMKSQDQLGDGDQETSKNE